MQDGEYTLTADSESDIEVIFNGKTVLVNRDKPMKELM